MSERWPAGGSGSGRRGRDEPEPDWLEHSGSSVFDAPPSRAGRDRDRPPPDPSGDPWADPSVRPPWPEPSAPAGADQWGAPPERAADPWQERRRRAAPWATPPGGQSHATPAAPPTRPQPPARPPSRDGGPPPGARGRDRGAGRADDRDRRDGGSDGGGLQSPIGLGAVVGGLGVLDFLAALVVLPWFTAGGDDVTLSDLRSAFEVPATDPADLPGAGDPAATTLPEGIPSPDDVAGAVEQEARDAATSAAASAIDDGKSRYLELYADTLWLIVAATVSVATLLSTVLAPRSMALSLLLGVRRFAGAAIVLAALAHAAALWVVFTGDGAPSPAMGVWLGVAGLAGVLAGCVIGPRSR